MRRTIISLHERRGVSARAFSRPASRDGSILKAAIELILHHWAELVTARMTRRAPCLVFARPPSYCMTRWAWRGRVGKRAGWRLSRIHRARETDGRLSKLRAIAWRWRFIFSNIGQPQMTANADRQLLRASRLSVHDDLSH